MEHSAEPASLPLGPHRGPDERELRSDPALRHVRPDRIHELARPPVFGLVSERGAAVCERDRPAARQGGAAAEPWLQNLVRQLGRERVGLLLALAERRLGERGQIDRAQVGGDVARRQAVEYLDVRSAQSQPLRRK